MPAIPKEDAIQRIANEIDGFAFDDLVEVHGELFPAQPAPDQSGQPEWERLATEIKHHFQNELEVEELVGLWNVVFPKDRNVWYDYDADIMHFNEAPEYVDSTE